MTQRHKEIIQLVQAHGEGKTMQVRSEVRHSPFSCSPTPRIGEWKEMSEWKEMKDHDMTVLLEALYEQSKGKCSVRIKPEPKYRAWREDKIPDVAQYREKNNHQVKWFAEKEEARGLYHLYRYEYRTDLSKDEWYPCGVEIKEGAEDAKNS